MIKSVRAMDPYIGFLFYHKHREGVFRVTSVRKGMVYFRPVDGGNRSRIHLADFGVVDKSLKTN